MKKSILAVAVAVLSMFAGVSHAVSTIDLYQVAGTLENQTDPVAGAEVLGDPLLAQTQLTQALDGARINVIQGNVADQVIIVNQAGASTANVFTNIDAASLNAAPDSGDLSGAIADAANLDVETTGNYINVNQAVDGDVANIMLDGTNNSIVTNQNLAGAINVTAHAVNSSIAITQSQ